MTLSSSELKTIAPSTNAMALNTYPALLCDLMPKYEINTIRRVQCFLSQLAHESGSFVYTKEIASGIAYEGRSDLGNTQPGDGKKFKGRGLIQVTGRNNYLACSRALFSDDRLLKSPELLEQPKWATESACWFWKTRGLNEIADQDETWTTVVRKGTPKETVYNKFQYITYRINGDQNGYDDRLAIYNRARQVITMIS